MTSTSATISSSSATPAAFFGQFENLAVGFFGQFENLAVGFFGQFENLAVGFFGQFESPWHPARTTGGCGRGGVRGTAARSRHIPVAPR
ncbi:hypothetical protein [Nonomuraea dietziae]|uniref:hypothetical protein n=1 Tax=Nonomuraea dietziae TaxID=65515 RepID=UPI003403F2EA